MPSKKSTAAAEYIEAHDNEVRLGLAEIAEFVTRLSSNWARTSARVRDDPVAAYDALQEAEYDYLRYVRLQLIDCLGQIGVALDRLEDGLPDKTVQLRRARAGGARSRAALNPLTTDHVPAG